jgi:hypothetical protein
VGIIQEQHPDRCRLFLEWKNMSWPVLVDSLNLLGVRGVPATYLIDEHGIVRASRLPPAGGDKLAKFLERRHERPADLPAPASFPEIAALRKAAVAEAAARRAWVACGDALFLRAQAAALGRRRKSGREDLDESIRAYRRATEQGAGPEAWFRLGVALRRRHETAARQRGDFQEALVCWGKALEGRPNQYIWRRRIEQYGPRLEKPYSFYDWVHKARAEIAARGDEPPELSVEPGGAELAYPAKSFQAAGPGDREPDPGGRIARDREQLVLVESAVAPAVVRRGKSARVHLILRPDGGKKAHWNNEAGKLQVWLRPPAALAVDRRLLVAESARAATSNESRELEFEVRVSPDADAGALTLPGYALYYVCEDRDGVCRYLRQDLEVKLTVK